MQYGFVIDNRVCIGCHACTVACKAEHLVPVGVNRTWVKYIERGQFPDVKRLFQVTRCNHCEHAPCVEICPTAALETREDGIVDFDNRRCIGCKACTQACPYDALYIDPETKTAAKCNFCAHRIEQGLNPSCVNICPEQAIRYGDLHDPQSDVSRLLAENDHQARRPEKGTKPALFYINGDPANMNPTATAASSERMWSEQSAGVGHNAGLSGDTVDLLGLVRKAQASAAGEKQKSSLDGLLRDLELATGQDKVRRAYDQPSKGIMWGWEVAAYILTKAIAAGAAFFGAIGLLFPGATWAGGEGAQIFLALVSLAFLSVTGALLVKDLDRPDRFHYVLLRPNFSSWLTRGAYVISAFGALALLWLVASLAINSWALDMTLGVLLLPLSLLIAGYTGFLFKQCHGRDFWQSKLNIAHMFVHAGIAGGALVAICGGEAGFIFGVSLAISFALIIAEVLGPQHSDAASSAAKDIRSGKAGRYFWLGVILLGHLLPLSLILVAWGSSIAALIAGLLAILGMAIKEYLWVYLPQKVPNA